jgi:hypothetical protein
MTAVKCVEFTRNEGISCLFPFKETALTEAYERSKIR